MACGCNNCNNGINTNSEAYRAGFEAGYRSGLRACEANNDCGCGNSTTSNGCGCGNTTTSNGCGCGCN